MTNITTFYVLPATITDQEKIDFELKICKLTDIKDDEGNLTNPATTKHSEFVDHPSDGTCNYAIDGFFEEKLTQVEKDSCKPSINFATAMDDTLYTTSEVKALGFFPDEE